MSAWVIERAIAKTIESWKLIAVPKVRPVGMSTRMLGTIVLNLTLETAVRMIPVETATGAMKALEMAVGTVAKLTCVRGLVGMAMASVIGAAECLTQTAEPALQTGVSCVQSMALPFEWTCP